MARIALLLLALVACKRDHGGPVASSPPKDAQLTSGSAAAGVAPPAASADLLHAVRARVAVSSLVKNPDITPFDLVDGSLDTAWNSKTGELVGAWIAFRLPPAAHVTEIQITAGFVSRGHEGDYFTLNPRIKHVVIYRNGTKLLEKDLDVARRELQSIPIGNEGGDYKIEVAAIEPGAKKNWRETCVSELRVMGSAPGMQPGHFSPEMTLGSLDAKPLEDPAIYLDALPGYASLEDFCAELGTKHAKVSRCPRDETGPFALPDPLPASWKGHWFTADLETATGSKTTYCYLAFEANKRHYVYTIGDSCGGPVRIQEIQPLRYEDSRAKAELVDVAGAPDKDLVLYTTRGTTEWLTLCAPTTTGVPSCGDVQIADLEFHNNSGGDQWDEWSEYKKFYDPKVVNGWLELSYDVPGRPIRIRE